MTAFGYFKGLPYGECNNDFEVYRNCRNSIPKEKICSHMDSPEKWNMSLTARDIFTGEKLDAGKIVDGEFVFPPEFLRYYKNYGNGIPPEYEEYLKSIGVGEEI